MNNQITNTIEQKYSHAKIKKCCEQGCSIKFDNVGLQFILKGEKMATIYNKDAEKACDCIAFLQGHQLTICVVELKSKSLKPSEIFDKFKNTTEIITCILKTCQVTDYKIILILAAKVFRKKPSSTKLFKQRININEKSHKLHYVRCNLRISGLGIL